MHHLYRHKCFVIIHVVAAVVASQLDECAKHYDITLRYYTMAFKQHQQVQRIRTHTYINTYM